MTNPNPFVPKGSLLEQQSARRSRLKLTVFCVIAISSVGLVAMLIQGCKREQPGDTTPPDTSTNVMSADTNTPPILDTNSIVLPPPTNVAPAYVPPATSITPVVDTSMTVYEVEQGDTLGKIAKAHHITVKELEAANPNVDPKRLKVKQKITIPPSSATSAPTTMGAPMTDVSAGNTYVVKSGDTLSKIAKVNGTTVKALEAANPGIDPNHLKVKQKLNLPVKVDATPVAPVPAPALSMPALPATSAPSAAAPATAPGK
jgi:LysM repeat protein